MNEYFFNQLYFLHQATTNNLILSLGLINSQLVYILTNFIMEVHVIAVGKSNDNEINQLVDRYSKRIAQFTKFQFHVLGQDSKGQRLNRRMTKLNKNAFFISLDSTGQQLSSREFADLLKSKTNHSYNKIIFLIGGPFGLLSDPPRQTHLSLSFSKMTLTHQLIRVILLEQIYRAFTIIGNHPYHHG